MNPLQAVVDHSDHLDATAAQAATGTSREPIFYIVEINDAGAQLCLTFDPRPARRMIPRPVERSNGIKPNVAYDKPSYSFGVDDPGERRPGLRFEAYRKRLFGIPEWVFERDPGLAAQRRFYEQFDPVAFATTEDAALMRKHTGLVGFRLEGKALLTCESPALMEWLNAEQVDAPRIICSLTGEPDFLAINHPTIKGVPGTESTGARLISFNSPCTQHYGKLAGANCGIGVRAAAKIGRAMTHLLSRDAHPVLEKNSALLVWSNDDPQAAIATMQALQGHGGAEPAKVEEHEVQMLEAGPPGGTVADIREGLRCGTPAASVAGRLFMMNLRGRQGRIAITNFFEGTLENSQANVAKWFRDLEIVGRASYLPGIGPGFAELNHAVAAHGINGKVIDGTAFAGRSESFLEAGLHDRPVGDGIVQAALTRLRNGADHRDRTALTSLLKLELIRRHGMTIKPDDIPDCTDEGYHMGGLLALVELAQYHACGGKDLPAKTVADRYWTLASTAPRRAAGALDNMFMIYMRQSKGSANWLYPAMEKIWRERGDLPAVMSRKQQCLFAVGYAHAKYRRKTAAAEAAPASEDGEKIQIA